MKNVSLDLSHNDPEKLFGEFLNPLEKFFPRKDDEDTTVAVKVEDRRGYVSTAMVIVEVTQVRPGDYDDNWTALAEWKFYKDGTAVPKDGGEDDQVNWSIAACEIVRVCHDQMLREIKRVDERVKPALAKLEATFPSACEVAEI